MSHFYINFVIRLVISMVLCFICIDNFAKSDPLFISNTYDTQFNGVDTTDNTKVCAKVKELLQNKTIKYGNFNVGA